MSLKEGSIVEGKVTGITNFGAFVLLPGGETGLVHISEVADTYVKDINEYLNLNDPVKVKILNVGSDGKVGLSIKKAQKQESASSLPERKNKTGNKNRKAGGSFEDKLSQFMKESDEKQQDLKKHTESKRGGRSADRQAF